MFIKITTKTKSINITTKVLFIKITTAKIKSIKIKFIKIKFIKIKTIKIKLIRLTSLLGWAPGITVSVLAGESGEGLGVP